MNLGIMQPYFFPYLGYFDVMNRVDKWIVFDTVKYNPKGWMNRNRILHPKEGWQFISVPVHKHVGEMRVCDVVPVSLPMTEKRLLGQIEHYQKGKAPFFKEVKKLVQATFAPKGIQSLSALNVSALNVVSEYLGIAFDYSILSQIELDLPKINHPGQWALEISDKLGAKSYFNPPGGKSIFSPVEWRARGINLEFTELIQFKYSCGSYVHVEHLSILDVLMWNEPQKVKMYLDSLRIED